jgi:hypothetical protein
MQAFKVVGEVEEKERKGANLEEKDRASRT